MPCRYNDVDQLRRRLRENSLLNGSVDHNTLRRKHVSHTESISTGYEPNENDVLQEDDNHNDGDLRGVNSHTLNTEFHGSTSSLSFLAAVQKQATMNSFTTHAESEQLESLVSAFHNDSFTSDCNTEKANDVEQLLSAHNYYFRQSQLFLNGYLQNMHFIIPVIDQAVFLSRCEDLWFGRSKPSQSFLGLYYAVMSLGALTREWIEDSRFDGLGRFHWSRTMFQLSDLVLRAFPCRNDLESVQANLILGKVCQNVLNSHLAYMYVGKAVRISLSAGYNRRSTPEKSASQRDMECDISRTWWGLFSLEMELSFWLGRPDSLGIDAYHTRALPPADESETAILTCMVDFARILRKVSVSLYLSDAAMDVKLDQVGGIQAEMDVWLGSLPIPIRPDLSSIGAEATVISKDPPWAKRQRHTLKLRYYNVQMVLYRPFLLYTARSGGHCQGTFQQAVSNCVSAARNTINMIHHMFCTYSYFRSWWYNTTYTLYAASIILYYARTVATQEERLGLLQLIEMSIQILSAMDENVVAKKVASILERSAAQGFNEVAIPRVSHEVEPHADDPFGLITDVSAASQRNDGLFNAFGENEQHFMTSFFAPSDDTSFLWNG